MIKQREKERGRGCVTNKISSNSLNSLKKRLKFLNFQKNLNMKQFLK